MRNLLGIMIALICLAMVPPTAHAAKANKASKAAQPTKERLVLMPLRVADEDKKLQGAMETALVEGLQQKYVVFSGEQVAQKAREIFLKESRNTTKKDCDETRCMQNIAEAFQAELIATANVTKQEGGYFLALSIQNIFDNKVEYSKSLTCEGCSSFKVVEKLKELSGSSGISEADEAAIAAERKLKAEQLKQDQLAFEQKLRNADASERKRLLEAKAQDDKHLAELKTAAEARRKSNAVQQSGDYPTVESAIAEIKRLNVRINAIEAGYEKDLAQTRKNVSQRYAEQLGAVNEAQRDEFETSNEFKAKQEKQRADLIHQRDNELKRLNAAELAAAETAPLQNSIKTLSEREYFLTVPERLLVELGSYNADAQEFPIRVGSKIPAFKLTINGTISLLPADAKTFKQQWQAGLVRAEVNVKPNGQSAGLVLVNDADNSRLFFIDGKFLSGPAMVRIPGKNYELGKYEVTQAEWKAVMGDNPSNFRNCGDACPVEQVSWDDIQTFLQKLNVKTGKQYRLPTEAEWEYACYGGNKTEYCGGNDIASVAWYNKNSGGTTHPAGQKQANGYGLYDMSGNVWEWMSDCLQVDCGKRVLRGGSWYGNPDVARSANRNDYSPAIRNLISGFRVARTLP